MNSIASFTDLKAWQEGHKLVLMIYKITDTFSKAEQFGLTNQIRRSAVSITSNIAEGFSKRSLKEKIQFYTTAIASLTELQNQILISRDVGFLSTNLFQDLANQTVTTGKLINGLIRSTKSRTSSS